MPIRDTKFLCMAVFVGLLAGSGCTGVSSYFSSMDAPETIRDGKTDPRLALTRTLGGSLSPIVRNMAAPHGRLHFAQGLETHLAQTLRPLDIILVRSRPALTRAIFPSHFTHSIVWLGTPDQLRDNGGLRIAGSHAGEILAGNSVFESAGDNVRLRGIDQILNTAEFVILRPANLGPARLRTKYAALLAKLGTPFDYNFDYADTSRLTCMEAVAEAFPEFGIPVRYTTGRYAIIPDDIVRRAMVPGSGLTLVSYIKPYGPDGFTIGGASEAAAVLSETKAKPRYARVY